MNLRGVEAIDQLRLNPNCTNSPETKKYVCLFILKFRDQTRWPEITPNYFYKQEKDQGENNKNRYAEYDR
jgi:hypothetical protein